ncbi:MAG: chloride channel protein [Phycisphaeraceae bacterium]
MPMKQLLKDWGLWPETGARELGRRILLAVAVGVAAGIGGIAFLWMSHLVTHVGLDWIAGLNAGGSAGEPQFFTETTTELTPWVLIVVLMVGGLISGWLVYTFAPEAEGHGTDAAIDAYHNKGGLIRGHVPIVKMFASAITLGTGGSGGREGPIAQIGAGFGSFLATRLKLSDTERRTLMAAGVGAGIGAIFQAPLAGAIFATEVLYRDPDFEAENLIPAFIATTVAYCVLNLGLTVTAAYGVGAAFRPLFDVAPGMRFDEPLLLMPLTVLAVAMALASLLYVKCFYGVHHLFKRMRVPNVFKPVIGAAATGVIAITAYYLLAPSGQEAQHDSLGTLSFGYGFLQKILNPTGQATILIPVLLVVGIGKILTTSLTIGSGGSAGVFGPSMVIGGSLGAVVGLLLQKLFPGVVTRVDVFVILGMASFFSAAANTPVSTIIMVSEMTATYALLLPSMWVCAIAYMLGHGWTIYSQQVASRRDSAAHRGDFIIDVLQGLTIRDAIGRTAKDFATVPIGMPLSDIVYMVADTHQTCFPVLNDQKQFYGMFTFNDVRQFLYETDGVGGLAVAQDLAQDVKPLTLQMDLSSAIGRFAEGRYEELPVVDADAPDTIIGMLRRQDIIAAYSTQLLKLRRTRQDP